MGVSLADHEHAVPFAGDAAAALAAVQDRLANAHRAQVAHGRRSVILLEGWDGSGRKGALKAIAAALDPCHFAVHGPGRAVAEPGHHWLAPYWARLPRDDDTAAFFPSWYRGTIDERVGGRLEDKAWARRFDEINEFEAQQTDHGTILIKLFFHLAAETQAERLRARSEDPWQRGAAIADPAALLASRNAYEAAWHEMFRRSHTRWAAWSIIDSGDEASARISALQAVSAAIEKSVPAAPPAGDEPMFDLRQENLG